MRFQDLIKNISKHDKTIFYTRLRWKSWRMDKSKVWQSAMEKDLGNKSWQTWRMIKASTEASTGETKNRWKQKICVKWWDCNLSQTNRWSKHKCHISIIFPRLFEVWLAIFQLHHLIAPFSTAVVSWQPTGVLVPPDVYLDKPACNIYGTAVGWNVLISNLYQSWMETWLLSGNL